MRRNIAVAAAIDVACILVFVAIGRRSHDESGSVLAGAARVAAPFLIALAVGWVVLRVWTSPRSVDRAVPLWLITVALGLVLRNLVFDRGTALPFVIVATLFTGLLLVGWRLFANRVGRST
jgi:multisubunit Na+/H+ antiporter MnhF subunit